MTLKNGIEQLLKEQVPEVKEVIEELKPQSPFLKTTLSKKEVAQIDPEN